MRPLDEQSYPRGDWSGDPETFYRPHSHIGGDLPPNHPWGRLRLEERAAMWARGYRPDPFYMMDPKIRYEQWFYGLEPPCLVPGGGCRRRTEPLYSPSYWPQAFLEMVQREDEGAGDHMVGLIYYDPDLAKFGNAMSPFVEMASFKDAHLAMQRPFEDRYNPRYESQDYFSSMPPSPPMQHTKDDEVSRAYDYLVSLFAEHPEITETIMISYAGARLPDGSYIDTRTPGRGLISEEESRQQPAMNAVSFGIETRAEANRLRAMVGDEIFGVPIVYSVREEWRKRMPRIGRPLRDDELPGLG